MADLASIPLDVLALVWAGAFFGALAAGGAGFAFALAAGAIWLHILDPLHTTALVVACGLILHIGLIWRLRHAVEWRRLWPFVAGALIGIPLGVLILARSDADPIKMTLGFVLAGYGIFALMRPDLPVVKRGGALADAAVGMAGGMLGGLGGYSGVLPAIWAQLRGWSKDIARGVYQPFILLGHFTTLVLVGPVAFDARTLMLLAVAVSALPFGAGLGWMIYGRLDERRFRQVLAGILLMSGLTLVF